MLANKCSQHLFCGTEAETMPQSQPSLKTRLAHALFGDIIHTAVAEATVAVGTRTELSRSVFSRVDDTPGWNRLAAATGPSKDSGQAWTPPSTTSARARPPKMLPRPDRTHHHQKAFFGSVRDQCYNQPGLGRGRPAGCTGHPAEGSRL